MYPVEKPKKKIWIWLLCGLGGLILLGAIAGGVLFGYNHFSLTVIPEGEDELLLEYGEAYQEMGARAEFRGSRFWQEGFAPEAEILKEGTVDTTRVGTYTVTYTADYYWWHASAERTVTVVDRKAPEIRLNANPDVYVLPGGDYEEEGYEAYDEYDGDLTDQVERHEEDGVIIYSVTDSSGNRTEVTRVIHYDDPIPPQITLEGESSIQIYTGTQFKDPGYTAWDNCDGDITDRVTVKGSVDPYRSGTYTLTYTVTDEFENTATVTRTVKVVPKPQPEQLNPDGKVIYLTFDDGPGIYTRQLLEVLNRYNVKATFFVVSNKYADIIGEIAAAGHAVGIHSASHDYSAIYASEDAYFADLYLMQSIIYEQTGITTTLLRFPGGSSNTVSRFNKGIMSRLTVAVQEAGFQYFDWNVDSNDAGGAKTADEVFENVVKGISSRKVAVVLQHDIKGFSVEAVEKIIIWGLENGYTFLPLDAASPTSHHGVNN